MHKTILVCGALGLAACGGESSKPRSEEDAGCDSDVDTDVDTDADTDSDTGSGTGSDTDTGPCVPETLRDLDPPWPWYGENQSVLQDMIELHGRENCDAYDAASPPVAVFDWDNTVIKNDVGDLVTFYMLEHDLILNPVGGFAATSRFLTPEAVAALDAACGSLVAAGEPLPTSTECGCALEILSVYYESLTTQDLPAFAGANARTMEPAYAWTVQLQAGHTPEEVVAFADLAISEGLAADCGATQDICGQSMSAFVRIYEPIRDLVGTLQENGFDVWVLSASGQSVVEAFADEIGVDADRVVGVRTVVGEDGRLGTGFEPCGSAPIDSLITYVDGKRCWVNQEIFGLAGDEAMGVSTDPARRIVFAAGDSDTDVTFLRDATGLRLAINRNKKELMCNAYWNAEGTWIVNPMWIGPKGELAAGYACSTNGCFDSLGRRVACTDEDGVPIGDQADTVFWSDDYCE